MEVYFEGQFGKLKEDQMELINVWFPLILIISTHVTYATHDSHNPESPHIKIGESHLLHL